MQTVRVEKTYNAPIQKVWKAISDKEQMKQWYFDFPKEFKLEVGATFDWEAGEPGGKQWLHRGKMLEIVPEKKLSHTWEYPGYSGSSKVTWELTAIDKDTTKLVLTHEFTVPFDAKEKAFAKENFEAGWNHIITIALVDFLKK